MFACKTSYGQLVIVWRSRVEFSLVQWSSWYRLYSKPGRVQLIDSPHHKSSAGDPDLSSHIYPQHPGRICKWSTKHCWFTVVHSSPKNFIRYVHLFLNLKYNNWEKKFQMYQSYKFEVENNILCCGEAWVLIYIHWKKSM